MAQTFDKRWRYRILRAVVRLARMLGRRGDSADRDQLLARRLHEAFEQRLSAEAGLSVQFYVMEGVVTVYGTVRNELDRDLVLGVARSVRGVRKAVSHLQVVAAEHQ